jgi:Domain of unknown function (DUF4386)
MGLAVEKTEAEKTQRTYVRLAGSLFLGVILIALVGGSILSPIPGAGSFAETAARITSSERLYRVALSTVLIATLSSTLLAFALYATLPPAYSLLAQLALIFSLNDSFLALIVRMCGFARMHLYVSAQTTGAGPVAAQALLDLMGTIGSTAENLGGICFAIGSALFGYLFFKSPYIPKLLSTLGVCASEIWTGLYLANLIIPGDHALFQYIGFPPMAIADIS